MERLHYSLANKNIFSQSDGGLFMTKKETVFQKSIAETKYHECNRRFCSNLCHLFYFSINDIPIIQYNSRNSLPNIPNT